MPERFTRARWALALIALALTACRVVVIGPALPTPVPSPGSPAPTETPAPPFDPTYAPGVITVEAVVPPFNPVSGTGAQIVTLAPTREGPALPRPLYFLSDRDGRAQVYLLVGDGSAPRRITDEPLDVRGYALDPDGEFLVAYTDRRVLIVYNQRLSNVLDIDAPSAAVRGIALSPDGARLAFWTDAQMSVYAVGPTGERFLRLVGSASITGAVWSADGTRLVYVAPEGVHRLDLDAGRDDLALAAEGATYRVDGAVPGGRWAVASTITNGACRATLVPFRSGEPTLEGLPCPLTFAPDGSLALWTPRDAATIQVVQMPPGGARPLTAIADYAAYAPSWPLPETSLLWTCAFRNRACPPGTLDLYAVAWPSAQLTLRWDSAAYRALPQDGGAAPADPAWETFAVVFEDAARGATGLLAITPATGAVQVVADAGNNWMPQWLVRQ